MKSSDMAKKFQKAVKFIFCVIQTVFLRQKPTELYSFLMDSFSPTNEKLIEKIFFRSFDGKFKQIILFRYRKNF